MNQIPNSSPSGNAGLIAGLVNRLRLVGRLMRDPRVPFALKLVPVAPLIYVLLPIDFLPDIVPLLGQIDDIGMILLGLEAFIMLAPNDVVDEHKAAIAGGQPYAGGAEPAAPRGSANVVDGEFREVGK